MTVMKTGTTYEQRKDNGKTLTRRFHECKKCKDRIYTYEPSFQECMNKVSGNCRNR